MGNPASPPVIATDRKQLEHETATALSQTNYQSFTVEETAKHRAHQYNRIIGLLPRYSDNTLRRFIAAAPELDSGLRYLLFVTSPDEEHINDWVTIEPVALEEVMNSEPVIRGLHRYEKLAPQGDGNCSSRRIAQVRAIARVTARFLDLGHGIEHDVNDEGFNIHYIENVELRDLITTHKNPGAVADLIIQRDITDADQIRSLLSTMNATSSAIHDGTL